MSAHELADRPGYVVGEKLWPPFSKPGRDSSTPVAPSAPLRLKPTITPKVRTDGTRQATPVISMAQRDQSRVF